VAREKDSVLFYVGLKQFVPEKDRQTVNEIIREEVRHIVKISELRNELI
jgi:rubrerythrin